MSTWTNRSVVCSLFKDFCKDSLDVKTSNNLKGVANDSLDLDWDTRNSKFRHNNRRIRHFHVVSAWHKTTKSSSWCLKTCLDIQT